MGNVLFAFYDLQVAPATFDIVKFLVLAELERQQAGCDSLHIVIVPGPDEGFRGKDLKIYRELGADFDIGYMQYRLRNLLVPCCWLIPSCSGVSVCGSRCEAERISAECKFPKEYTVQSPVGKFREEDIMVTDLPSIEATPQALYYVKQWLPAGRKVVTISLRETPYESVRNTDAQNWIAFANSLDKSVYAPIIIRDMESAFRYELEAPVFPEIPWSIELRIALYELSYLNMFINLSGLSNLAIFNQKTRLLLFKPLAAPSYEAYWRSQGLELGSQMPQMAAFQRLVWEDDNLEVICREFKLMCDGIEGVL